MFADTVASPGTVPDHTVILAFLTGSFTICAALGAILIKDILDRKSRRETVRIEERRRTYSAFIIALHEFGSSSERPSDPAAEDRLDLQMRLALVGVELAAPADTVRLAQQAATCLRIAMRGRALVRTPEQVPASHAQFDRYQEASVAVLNAFRREFGHEGDLSPIPRNTE